MKIFKGRLGSSNLHFPDISTLCPACRKAFEDCFKKDEKGRIDLDFSHNPKLCSSCRERMEQQFHLSLHPDRG